MGVRSLAAPPVEQHVLALHRHGHHLGGLPTSFWVLLAFLIVIFHLFLFKLVYNEWIRYDRSAGAFGGGGSTLFARAAAGSRTRYAL